MTNLSFLNKYEREVFVLNWSVALMILWVSFAFTKTTEHPGFSLRYLGIQVFILFYFIYFIWLKRRRKITISRIGVWAFSSLCLFIGLNVMSGFFAVNKFESIMPVTILVNQLFLLVALGHAFQNGLSLRYVSLFYTILALITSFYAVGEIAFVRYYNVLGDVPVGFQFNSNFFSSSQVLTLPFVCIVYILEGGKRRLLSVITLVAILLTICLAQTRSAMLSALTFMVVLSFIYLWNNNVKRKIDRSLLKAMLLLCSLTVIATLVYQNRKSLTVLVSDSHNIEHTTNQKSSTERLIIWKNSLEIFDDSPFLGVGPGNWKIHFAGIKNPPYRAASGKRVVVSPHNVYLEILCEVGLLGLFVYFFFALSVLYSGKKSLDSSSTNQLPIAVFVSILCAYLIDQFFSFPNFRPTHIVYISIPLAYIIFIPSREALQVRLKLATTWIALVVAAVFLSFILTSFYFVFEINLERAKRSVLAEDYSASLLYLSKSQSSYPGLSKEGDSAHYMKGVILNATGRPEEAISELVKAWQLSPYNPRVFQALGDAYYLMREYSLAIGFLERAYEVQAKNNVVYKKLGLCYCAIGDYEACVAILDQINLNEDPEAREMLKSARSKINLL